MAFKRGIIRVEFHARWNSCEWWQILCSISTYFPQNFMTLHTPSHPHYKKAKSGHLKNKIYFIRAENIFFGGSSKFTFEKFFPYRERKFFFCSNWQKTCYVKCLERNSDAILSAVPVQLEYPQTAETCRQKNVLFGVVKNALTTMTRNSFFVSHFSFSYKNIFVVNIAAKKCLSRFSCWLSVMKTFRNSYEVH